MGPQTPPAGTAEPTTPQEWQEAADLAYGLLALEAARQYGLVTGGPTVNAARAHELLARAAERGITPDDDAVEAVMLGTIIAGSRRADT